MTDLFGSAFAPIVLPIEPPDDLLALRLELVLTALDTLASSMRNLPTPQVFVDAPDLAAIVSAVNGLKPGVDADQIAAAVVSAIAPSAVATEEDGWKGELLAALKKLDFRMKGDRSGSNSVITTIPDRPDRQLGIVSVTGAVATIDGRTLTERMSTRAPAVGYHLWLDVLSSDTTHIIVAEAPDGSAPNAAVFRGTRVTLDVNGNPVGAVETALNFAWATRTATPVWVS